MQMRDLKKFHVKEEAFEKYGKPKNKLDYL